jgi:hypothetical protein
MYSGLKLPSFSLQISSCSSVHQLIGARNVIFIRCIKVGVGILIFLMFTAGSYQYEKKILAMYRVVLTKHAGAGRSPV